MKLADFCVSEPGRQYPIAITVPISRFVKKLFAEGLNIYNLPLTIEPICLEIINILLLIVATIILKIHAGIAAMSIYLYLALFFS